MEITRTAAPRSAAHSWDMEVIVVAVLVGLALIAVTVAVQRYNPAPSDAEAGWFLCP
jgi:hypothetical protein